MAEIQETDEQDSIDVSGDEEEGGEPEPSPEKVPGERPSKTARRNRYQELKTEAEQKTQLLEQERQARILTEQRLNAIQEQLNRFQGQQQGGDPIDNALEENFRARQELDEQFQSKQGKLTKEELVGMQRKAQWLEDQRSMLNTERVNRSRPQVNPQEQALEMYAAANHPDVVNNPHAVVYFKGELAKKVAAAGIANQHIDPAAMVKATLEQTERDLRIGKYRNGAGVDPGLASRLSGVSRGAGSNGGSSPVTDRVVMTDQYKVMAETAFPELVKTKGAKAAHEKWAHTVGKRVLQQGGKLNQ